MPFLLDTHTFLWWCWEDPDLSHNARIAIENNDSFVSLVSIWEISIKVGLGKLTLPDEIGRYLKNQLSANGFSTLDIGFQQIIRTAALPQHHRDPFDRLLAAQAMEQDLPLISRDPIFDLYGVRRVW